MFQTEFTCNPSRSRFSADCVQEWGPCKMIDGGVCGQTFDTKTPKQNDGSECIERDIRTHKCQKVGNNCKSIDEPLISEAMMRLYTSSSNPVVRGELLNRQLGLATGSTAPQREEQAKLLGLDNTPCSYFKEVSNQAERRLLDIPDIDGITCDEKDNAFIPKYKE